MKVRTFIFCIPLLILGLIGCSQSPEERAALDELHREIDSIGSEYLTLSEDEDEENEDINTSSTTFLLSDDEAERIVKTFQLLDQFPGNTKSSLLNEPLYTALRKSAEAKLSETYQGFVDFHASVNKAKLANQENLTLIKHQLESYLEDIAKRSLAASASEQIIKLAAVEGELKSIHEQLIEHIERKIVPDPEYLLSKEDLEYSLNAKKRLIQRLEINSAKLGGEAAATLELFRSEYDRVTRIKDSEGYKKFRSKYPEILSKVDFERWNDAEESRNEKSKVEFERNLIRAQESSKEFRDGILLAKALDIDGSSSGNKLSNNTLNGNYDRLVLSAIADYEVDVRKATHAESRIQNLVRYLSTNYETNELINLYQFGHPRSSLRLVSDGTLQRIVSVLSEVERKNELRGGVPLGSDALERARFISEWLESAKEELAARNDGSLTRVHLSEAQNSSFDVSNKLRPVDFINNKNYWDLPGVREGVVNTYYHRFGSVSAMPLVVADEVVSNARLDVDQGISKIGDITRRWQNLGERMALSLSPVSADLVEQYGKLTKDLTDTAELLLFQHSKLKGKKGNLKSSSDKDKGLLALLPFRELPKSPPSTPSPFSPLDPSPVGFSPSGGGNDPLAPFGKSLKHDIALGLVAVERSLLEIEAKLKPFEKSAKKIVVDAPKFAKEKGRMTIAKSKANVDIITSDLLVKEDKTRLPKNYRDWVGRINPDTGNPYSINDVLSVNTFKAVGGGIHFLQTAEYEGKKDFTKFILVYDSETNNLVLKGPKGEEYTYPVASPEILKSMYRFVSDGDGNRNAAISIGWGMERKSIEQILSERGDASIVLLDPYFVDTAIGQDLFLADSIPWDLDEEKLPNGKLNPIHAQFSTEKERFDRSRFETISNIVSEVSVDHELNIEELVKDLDPAFKKLVNGVLTASTKKEIKKLYIGNVKNRSYVRNEILKDLENRTKSNNSSELVAFLNLEGMSSQKELSREFLLGKYRLDRDLPYLKNRYDKIVYEYVYESLVNQVESKDFSNPYNLLRFGESSSVKLVRAGITSEKFIEIVKSKKADIEGYITKTLAAKLVNVSENKQDFVPEMMQLILGMPLQYEEKVSKELVTVVTEIKLRYLEHSKSQEQEKENIANKIGRSINPTTLAMFVDDDVIRWGVSGGEIYVKGNMSYRYASQRILDKDGYIKLADYEKNEKEGRTIVGLTSVANEALQELKELYPPLLRTENYARLAAFLRWAKRARESGELGFIDFSSLAMVPAHNRKSTPTPDGVYRY